MTLFVLRLPFVSARWIIALNNENNLCCMPFKIWCGYISGFKVKRIIPTCHLVYFSPQQHLLVYSSKVLELNVLWKLLRNIAASSSHERPSSGHERPSSMQQAERKHSTSSPGRRQDWTLHVEQLLRYSSVFDEAPTEDESAHNLTCFQGMPFFFISRCLRNSFMLSLLFKFPSCDITCA